MMISRNGTRPTQPAGAEHFTGRVQVEYLFQSSAPARAGAAYVAFEPCARSDWHTHPLGQTLIVTFGCGLHQRWGGPIEEIRPGDVVTVGPNEKHWHGASPTTAMTHIAIQESVDGKAVDWLEKVTDTQYEGRES
jgi:quercetin dioxygenase-like cupin family protein